jgi:hypothetical protein
MGTVYVVVETDYTSSQFHGVFSDKQKALEKHNEVHGANIYECTVDGKWRELQIVPSQFGVFIHGHGDCVARNLTLDQAENLMRARLRELYLEPAEITIRRGTYRVDAEVWRADPHEHEGTVFLQGRQIGRAWINIYGYKYAEESNSG